MGRSEMWVTGELRRSGQPTESVIVDLEVNAATGEARIRSGSTDLGNWQVTIIGIQGTSFRILLDDEEWLFAPSNVEAFLEAVTPWLSRWGPGEGRSRPIRRHRVRTGFRRAARATAAGWRWVGRWSRVSARSDVALLVGGLCTAAAGMLIWSWPGVMLGAWGGAVVVFAATRFERRSRAQEAPAALLATGSPNGSVRGVDGPVRGLAEETTLARLLGASMSEPDRDPDFVITVTRRRDEAPVGSDGRQAAPSPVE